MILNQSKSETLELRQSHTAMGFPKEVTIYYNKKIVKTTYETESMTNTKIIQ